MTDVIDLQIPVSADLLVLARLTAATIAAKAGFNVEEIEDLRLAVDELCLPLVRAARGGRMQLRYVSEGDSIEISCTVQATEALRAVGQDGAPEGRAEGRAEGATGAEGRGQDGAPEGRAEGHPDDTLSARILDALVDAHGRTDGDGQDRHWLRKHRASLTV